MIVHLEVHLGKLWALGKALGDPWLGEVILSAVLCSILFKFGILTNMGTDFMIYINLV